MAPACRVCGEPLTLIDDQEHRWYCFKDDQVWLEKERRWFREMTEDQRSQAEQRQAQQVIQKQTAKYCKKCGNKLELEDKFCDRCGAQQKRSVWVEERKTTTAIGGGATETENIRARPSSAWYLVPIFFSILGGIIGYVAVKDEDKGMANDLLGVGIVMFFLVLFVFLLVFHGVP